MNIAKWILAFGLLLTLGCTSSSNSNSPRTPIVNGTSDSGGGNGIDGKAYEAYIVQPNQLAAYKVLIAPKIQQLLGLAPSGAPGDLVSNTFTKWLLYKTWYVAPVRLDTISKDVIGVSFSSDQTEQLALQTKNSIWIDSDRFSKMSLQDQATLIAHEMVMSLYYLRFKSWDNICSEKLISNDECSADDALILNEIFPGSNPQPFNADDYENIRSVTGRFLGGGAFSSYQEVDNFLISHHFDRRFTFGMGIEGSATTQEEIVYSAGDKISTEAVHQILQTAKPLNLWMDRCEGIKYNQAFPCTFEAADGLQTMPGNINVPSILFNVSSPTLSSSFFIPTITDINPAWNSAIEFKRLNKKISYYPAFSRQAPTPSIPGTFFRNAYLVTLTDTQVPNASPTLLGLISIPGIITGKTSDGSCTWATPSASSIQNDRIFIYSQYLNDTDKNLLRFRAVTFSAVTFCSK